MKKLIFTIAFSLVFVTFYGFNVNNPFQENPKIGDTLIVLKNKSEHYKYIKFPKRNILVKIGGNASYKSVYNIKVVITEVTENKFGRIDVKLKRVDGKKFFNRKKVIKAFYERAISNGELKLKS